MLMVQAGVEVVVVAVVEAGVEVVVVVVVEAGVGVFVEIEVAVEVKRSIQFIVTSLSEMMETAW